MFKDSYLRMSLKTAFLKWIYKFPTKHPWKSHFYLMRPRTLLADYKNVDIHIGHIRKMKSETWALLKVTHYYEVMIVGANLAFCVINGNCTHMSFTEVFCNSISYNFCRIRLMNIKLQKRKCAVTSISTSGKLILL